MADHETLSAENLDDKAEGRDFAFLIPRLVAWREEAGQGGLEGRPRDGVRRGSGGRKARIDAEQELSPMATV